MTRLTRRARTAFVRLCCTGLFVCAIGTVASDARAQSATDVQNPPSATIERGLPGQPPEPPPSPPPPAVPGQPAPARTAPVSVTSAGREARVTLRIAYTETAIRNPGTRQLDRVRLRAYVNEGGIPTNAPLVAPTIEVFPGETVRLTLRNELPPEPNCDRGDVNQPHCFNTTNMHAHGLEVSPAGNSDNVLISIRPRVDFQYEYNIPADHPAGTYWYHPHRHGSTALQVGSGMAGALVIRGTRLPTNYGPGDIDTLLRNRDGSPYPERLLLFQQIAYACRGAQGQIKTNPNGTWLCQPGDVGTIESYDQFGQNIWRNSGRYTTINGRTAEPLAQRAIVGRIERWRMIHAGVRDTIRMSIRKRRPGGAPFNGLSAQDQQAWIDTNCEPQVLSAWEIAADGLTRTRAQRKENMWLQPGYRSDLLVVFPTAGDYCVVDEDAPPEQSVNGGGIGRQLLTVVTAEGPTPTSPVPLVASDPFPYLRAELIAAARQFMPANVQQRVVDELSDLRLGAFMAPHPDLRGGPSNNQRLVTFDFPPSIGSNGQPPRPYDPTRIDWTLTLNQVDDWWLNSVRGGHPFHIHVNPFQIYKIERRGGDRRDFTNDPTSEYYGMAGVWKDTIFVQQDVAVVFRTKYQRYIGDFVLHCHILDHEDTGMMQNVRIALPDGMGGQAPATHDSMRHSTSGGGGSPQEPQPNPQPDPRQPDSRPDER